MNDSHPRGLAIVIVVALAIISLYLIARPISPGPVPAAFVPASNPPQAVSRPTPGPNITWSPAAITVFLLPGDIRQRTVSFTTGVALQNISIDVVPEIAPFLVLKPASIVSLSPNQIQTVQLGETMPSNTTSSNYNGTVHIKTGNNTIPQTLKVTITVGLPPDPGAAGNATLAGIDSDGDGVRDDVQRYIGLTYPQSAKERAALTQAALAIQDELMGDSNGVKEVGDASDCMGGTLMTSGADVVGGKNAHDAYLALRVVVLNTPDRAKAFAQADSQSGVVIRFSTPYAQQASRCSINPALFPN